MKKNNRKQFATLFGGAMNITDSPEYLQTIEIGKLLAEHNYIVKNGGYGGMMESSDMDFDPSEKLSRVCDEESEDYDSQSCESHKRYAGSEMTEALFGGQKKIYKNKHLFIQNI
jgi:hypothetical protein